MNRYLVGTAVVILLAIVGLIIIFSGGDGVQQAEKKEPKSLPEHSDTIAETSMTIRGEINGEDIHREIRITVGQLQRRLDIIAGYSDAVIQTQTYSNSLPAYREFLYAIAGAGFLAKKETSPAQANPSGKCPLGNLYEFELNDGGEVLSYLWTSTCSNAKGTLAVSSSTLQQLFKNQITDYFELTSGVVL